MRLYSPTASSMRSIQEKQQAWFFSNAFDTILRKHGLVLTDSSHNKDSVERQSGFVCRLTEWESTFEGSSLVFEGPLSTTVQQQLQLNTRAHSTDKLRLVLDGNSLGAVPYRRARVRRIPLQRTERSDPFPFESSNPYWNNRTIEYQSFDPPFSGKPVLFALTENGEELVVGLQQDQFLILGAPLFDLLVQNYAVPPYENTGYYDCKVSPSALVLKTLTDWLLSSAMERFQRGDDIGLWLSNWPAPFDAALTVRHDYDRMIGDRAITYLLNRYEELGIKSTWFWRLSTSGIERKQKRFWHRFLGAPVLQTDRVAQRGHEVALHTEVPTEKELVEKELAFFEHELGIVPTGYSTHGGEGAIGYLGLQQMEWASNCSMQYGEMLGTNSTLPQQAITIENGLPQGGSLVLHAVHQSLDAGMKPHQHHYDTLLTTVPRGLQRGQHCVVMNHPDIHVSELVQLLSSLDLSNVWSATLDEVSRWYRQVKLGCHRATTQNGAELRFEEPLQYPVNLTVGIRNQTMQLLLNPGTRSVAIRKTATGAQAVVQQTDRAHTVELSGSTVSQKLSA